MKLCTQLWFWVKPEDEIEFQELFPKYKLVDVENIKGFIGLAHDHNKTKFLPKTTLEQILIGKVEGQMFLPGTLVRLLFDSNGYDGSFGFDNSGLKLGLLQEMLKEYERKIDRKEDLSESSNDTLMEDTKDVSESSTKGKVSKSIQSKSQKDASKNVRAV
jgi:hypothetical protein